MMLMMVTSPLLFNGANVNSPAESSWGGSLGSGGLDTNIVITMAALLCALVIILVLTSIMQCRRRAAINIPREAVVGHLASTGLKKSELDRIPVTVYKAGPAISATDCPICLGEFRDGEKVRVLPGCTHGYHVRCIDSWLMAHSSCPTCRRPLIDRPLPGSAVMEGGVLSPENVSGRHSSPVVVVVDH